MKKQFPLLPHEMAFGLYFIVMWTQLVSATGFFGRDTLIYLGFMAVNVSLLVRCWRCESNRNWRLRLLFYPIAMNVFYTLSRTAVPSVHPCMEDRLLQALDHLLLGTNLSLQLDAWTHPFLTEIFSFCYLLFFPYLFFCIVYYFSGDLQRLKTFCSGLFTIYGLGLLGYALAPAAGPCVSMASQFQSALTGGFIAHLNSAIVQAGSNGVDVFPSLHCAVVAYLLFFDRTHAPRRFKVMLLPCLGLFVATIYLRYHYFTDVVCGFALTASSIWFVKQYEKYRSEIPALV